MTPNEEFKRMQAKSPCLDSVRSVRFLKVRLGVVKNVKNGGIETLSHLKAIEILTEQMRTCLSAVSKCINRFCVF